MRVFGCAAVAALGLSFASAAEAARFYEVSVTGTLVSELGLGPDWSNTGIDPNLKIGDTITLTARFSEHRIVGREALGYDMVGLYGQPTSGEEYWRIDAPGNMVFQTTDNMYDGSDWIYEAMGAIPHQSMSSPGIAFKDGKVLGLEGWMGVAVSSSRPYIDLGSIVGQGWEDLYEGVYTGWWQGGNFSDQFEIHPGTGLYNNFYNTPGFNGVWDFENSTAILTGIPEPATWAMMIVGFGLVGGAMRRSRQLPSIQRF